MARTVFWSWQSDQPARETRDLIQAALQRALVNLPAEFEEAGRLEIDHATKDASQSPDIVAAITARSVGSVVAVSGSTSCAAEGVPIVSRVTAKIVRI